MLTHKRARAHTHTHTHTLSLSPFLIHADVHTCTHTDIHTSGGLIMGQRNVSNTMGSASDLGAG